LPFFPFFFFFFGEIRFPAALAPLPSTVVSIVGGNAVDVVLIVGAAATATLSSAGQTIELCAFASFNCTRVDFTVHLDADGTTSPHRSSRNDFWQMLTVSTPSLISMSQSSARTPFSSSSTVTCEDV
jgi:hypothetical protein